MSDFKLGTVINLRGSYGFLVDDESQAHRFFHGGAIRSPLKLSDLREGDRVYFLEEDSDRGVRATDVQMA